jgi:membrane protein DedA with SNARE-associated domain
VHSLHHFLSEYGYWALAFLIGLESMGVPLPGETVLVMASMHAGHRGESMESAVVTPKASCQ